MSVPVRVYDLEGNHLQDFPSAKDAAEAIGLTPGMVGHCLNGDSNFAGSFQFRKLRKLTPDSIGVIENKGSGKDEIPVAKFWNGKLITVYRSMQEASEKNNVGSISEPVEKGWLVNGFLFTKINTALNKS